MGKRKIQQVKQKQNKAKQGIFSLYPGLYPVLVKLLGRSERSLQTQHKNNKVHNQTTGQGGINTNRVRRSTVPNIHM